MTLEQHIDSILFNFMNILTNICVIVFFWFFTYQRKQKIKIYNIRVANFSILQKEARKLYSHSSVRCKSIPPHIPLIHFPAKNRKE